MLWLVPRSLAVLAALAATALPLPAGAVPVPAPPPVAVFVGAVLPAYQEQPGGYARYSDLSNVYGTGTIIGLVPDCDDENPRCYDERPAELHALQSGKESVVRTGTLAGFLYSAHPWDGYADIPREFPVVDTTRPGTLGYRWVLPAWNGLPETSSPLREFVIRRATTVRISVVHGSWDPEGFGPGVFHYCVQRDPGMVPMMTVRISPSRPQREGYYEYAVGDRLVAERLLSNRRGIFRFAGPSAFTDARIIRIPAVSGLAGVSITFDPCH